MIIKAEKQYIFGKNEVTASCHASTVLPLPNGEVLAAWFGGLHESDKSVEIYVSKKDLNGVWSAPVCVTEQDEIPHWNPVLYYRENGEIILYYKYGEKIPTWITKYVISRDLGRTWSTPKVLVPGDETGGRGPVKNKCLKLSNGTLLAPASTEQGHWVCFIDKSFDDGITWERNPDMQRPKYKGSYVNFIQPTLWEGENGAVSCFMRTNKGAIYRSNSFDYGNTWCKPQRTRLPNNNSGIDIAQDSKKRLWLLYNPVDVDFGVRHPLTLSVSLDDGKHFTEIINLEPGNGEFSYPAILYQNGRLYITYTHKRKQIVYWEITLEE